MIQAGAFYRMVNDPLSGYAEETGDGVLLGVKYLPEKVVPENAYTEYAVRYRSVIANHGTRYSPPQMKRGMISGQIRVELGYSDIASEFNTADYDAIILMAQRAYGQNGMGPERGSGIATPQMQAVTQLLKWAETALIRPLNSRNELDRWNAIVNASVVMTGDNGFTETVPYSNPTGHRVAAGGTWSDDSYDPWPDVMGGAEFMRMKGFDIGSIVIGVDVRTILSNNEYMRLRAGRISVLASVVTGIPGRLTTEKLTELVVEDGLPAFTLYDKQYFTQQPATNNVTTRGVTVYGNWYFPRGTMVMFAKTGRNEEIDRGDMEPVIHQDTLGYVGVGRPAARAEAGMAIHIKYEDAGKNAGVIGQAWQASLPVILEPEGVYVIYGIE